MPKGKRRMGIGWIRADVFAERRDSERLRNVRREMDKVHVGLVGSKKAFWTLNML